MTNRERKILGEYCRDSADAIELRDWHIDLSKEPCDEDSCAQSRCRYGQKRIELRFPDDFPTASSPEDQRDTVIHELVHAHLDPPWKLLDEDVFGLLGREARALVVAEFTRSIEYAVDGLSRAIAKHLPLIDWGDSK